MLFVVVEKGIKVKMDIKEKLVELLGKMISPTMTIREQADFLISNEVTVVRHGRWVQQPLNGTHIWRCSKCETIGSPQWNYCPKCGTKMGDKLYG